MSKPATAYVQQTRIDDEITKRVFLLLAERTKTFGEEDPAVMGLELNDADIPALAPQAGLDAEEFRRRLRGLKQHVRMDVLEHPDGVWEIVYGPSYERPAPPPAPDTTRGGPHPFRLPGWDHYSTWGYEEHLGHLYAQIIHNEDDRDAEPRIWITPPRYMVRTVDELAQAIAEALAPYEPIPLPAEAIKIFLTRPPAT